MSLLSHMSSIVKAKMSAILDRADDPREALDYSYEKQIEQLRSVKRGVVEIVTAKRRLELQASGLKDNLGKLDDQARRALAAGREDMAPMDHNTILSEKKYRARSRDPAMTAMLTNPTPALQRKARNAR
jgi:phage shock protein A